MKNIVVLVLVITSFSCIAQRYLEYTFPDLKIDSMIYAKLDSGNMYLDLIQPANDKITTPRPLIIFVHGGSFKAGYRNKEDVYNYCKQWAHHGYAVATITYRLTLKGKSFHCDQLNKVKINTFKEASLDIHKATKFLIDNSSKFNIDTNNIILSGNSAGGEAILHAAYFSNHQLIEQVLSNSFNYAGLLSYAGAIIDTNLINQKNVLPTGLFHGTCDQWVPYATDYHHYCPENTPGALLLHGSKSIKERMENLNASYYFHSICGMDHIINKTALIYQFNSAAEFIYQTVLLDKEVQRFEVDKSQNKNCKYGNHIECND